LKTSFAYFRPFSCKGFYLCPRLHGRAKRTTRHRQQRTDSRWAIPGKPYARAYRKAWVQRFAVGDIATIIVKGLRDRSYGLSEMRIGNESDESDRCYSGTGENKTHFTASRKTGTTSSGVGSCISELLILSHASIHGRGVFFYPVVLVIMRSSWVCFGLLARFEGF
jgi:hypothetical protein